MGGNCRDCGINEATPEEWDSVGRGSTLEKQLEERVNQEANYHHTDWDTFVSIEPPEEEGSEANHPRDTQVAGQHYKTMKHQPLQQVLDDHGYEAFRGACLCKIYKYIGRDKEDRLRDYKAARHVLDWLIKETKT